MAETDTQVRVDEVKETTDPFANQRSTGQPATETKEPTASSSQNDRRQSSDEWDASKTPPSRFQKRKGSVHATPGSRDGHVDKNYERDAAYHAKLAEKGWGGKLASKVRRASTGEKEESK